MYAYRDAITNVDIVRVSYGTPGVGGRDGVSARKNSEGGQRIQAHGAPSKQRARIFETAAHGRIKTNFERANAAPRRRDDGAWMSLTHASFELRQVCLTFRNHAAKRAFETHFGFVDLLLAFSDDARR